MESRFNSGFKIKIPPNPNNIGIFRGQNINHNKLHSYKPCNIDEEDQWLIENNLTNWSVRKSNTTNGCLYYNKETGVSLWERPTINNPNPIKTNHSESLDKSCNITTEINWLKDRNLTNWTVRKSMTTNRCVYYNIKTKECQLHRPTTNNSTPIETNSAGCGPGCIIMGGSKKTRRYKKRKLKTIKRRK